MLIDVLLHMQVNTLHRNRILKARFWNYLYHDVYQSQRALCCAQGTDLMGSTEIDDTLWN